MIETITFIGSAATVGSKVWRPDGVQPYSTGAGPFTVKRFALADLDALAEYVGQCPANAFVVRGDPVPLDAQSIPYRRHRVHGDEPATLTPRAHFWLAVDVDRTGDVPRPDLRAAAAEARASLPAPFRTARCFAQATSSAGIVPGIRARLWFWCSRPVTDAECKEWIGAAGDPAIYTPSQPHYCAPPRFEGRADPLDGKPRKLWLDGDATVEVPAVFADPLKGFGPEAAGAVPGNRNVNLTSLAGSMRRRGMGEAAIAAGLTAHNAELAAPLPAAEIQTIARSVAQYVPEVADEPEAPHMAGGETLSEKARGRCEKALARVCARITDDPAHWQAHAGALGEYLHGLPGELAAQRVEKALTAAGTVVSREQIVTVLASLTSPASRPDLPWAEAAIKNEEGGLVACAENLSLLLRGHTDFQLWMNTRAQRPYWSACPWRAADTQVTDGDDFQLRCWLSRTLGWHKIPCDLLPAISEVAAAKQWDPWKGYLENLKWDGQSRLITAAERLLGADGMPATQITFAWWLISAVARTFIPGCQADHMLVLEGPQGEGKTSFLRDLTMHEAFFTRLGASADLGSVRTIGKIHGPVIVEIAELDVIKKATVEAVKTFVDERHDRVQWLYARSQTDVARTCVFAGTSNDREYLRDVTGNRRFWPIECGKIDRAALLLEREQLWAEAVHAFKAGARWWPTREEVVGLGLVELQDSRRVHSAAEEKIAAFLGQKHVAGRNPLNGVDLLPEQVGDGGVLQWITTGQLCDALHLKDFEAQAAMRALNWKATRVRLLTGVRQRAYIRPTEGA